MYLHSFPLSKASASGTTLDRTRLALVKRIALSMGLAMLCAEVVSTASSAGPFSVDSGLACTVGTHAGGQDKMCVPKRAYTPAQGYSGCCSCGIGSGPPSCMKRDECHHKHGRCDNSDNSCKSC